MQREENLVHEESNDGKRDKNEGVAPKECANATFA